MIKKFFKYFGIVLITLVSIALYFYYPQLKVLNGYAARTACSCAFLANRSDADILTEDLGMSPFQYANVSLDRINKMASSSVLGLAKKTAVFRNRLGCILLKDEDNYNVKFPSENTSISDNYQFIKPLHALPEDVKNEIIDMAFDTGKAIKEKKTRALLVLHRDSLILEEYADGIDANTRLLGWSMTKSVINALTGILVKQGKVKVSDNNLFKEWTDERKNITLESLLRMKSGLIWNEDYGKESEATTMLFDTDNTANFAKKQPLGEPLFNYSSGTTNMVTQILRDKFSNLDSFMLFPYEQLFNKLGMHTATIETDESGLFIGSSYMYASARDWMKFGKLYLNNGNWQGEQLFPDDWVKFTTTETPESDGRYGAHFWLNKRGVAYQDAPHDMFLADGYQGQYIAVIPSHDLIIVRLGLNDVDFNAIVKKITDGLKK